MNARRAAQLLAAGRVAVGVGLLVAPRRVAAGWLGEHSARPGVQAILRSLGARDAVIGMIALHTLDHPEVGPRWLRTAGAVDAVDAAATLAAARDLPASGVALTFIAAAGASLASFALARSIAEPS